VLAPDLPGFGSAQLPAADPAIDCFVDAILPVLNDEPAVVAGCSMGGYVALGIARRRPELVEALALVDTKATSDAPAAREGRERTAGLAEAGEDWSVGMITGLLGETTRARRPDAVRRVESVLATANAATVAWAQRAMAARPDSRDVVAALDVPILVVMGEEDTMSPRPE
ncbi:MAG: alpha/beta fold hydrolase, partial [Candidatus Nanopelagicales bacterium]